MAPKKALQSKSIPERMAFCQPFFEKWPPAPRGLIYAKSRAFSINTIFMPAHKLICAGIPFENVV
ncbi:MAG: hypothetical protein ACLVEL_09110 [Ruthenibacterium sp.]|jgi:hypothetical protein